MDFWLVTGHRRKIKEIEVECKKNRRQIKVFPSERTRWLENYVSMSLICLKKSKFQLRCSIPTAPENIRFRPRHGGNSKPPSAIYWIKKGQRLTWTLTLFIVKKGQRLTWTLLQMQKAAENRRKTKRVAKKFCRFFCGSRRPWTKLLESCQSHDKFKFMKAKTKPCKVCSRALAKSAEICPHCGARHTNPVAVILILILAGGITWMLVQYL